MNFEQHYPIIIIMTGLFISFLVGVYYVVKTIARTQGLMEAHDMTSDVLPPVDPPQRSYTIVFKNGVEHKFSGVKLEVVTEEYDDDRVESIKFISEGDEDLSEKERVSVYNQSPLFIDKSEILTVIETRTPKYSI